jgi:hypothetical protein
MPLSTTKVDNIYFCSSTSLDVFFVANKDEYGSIGLMLNTVTSEVYLWLPGLARPALTNSRRVGMASGKRLAD